MKMLLIKTKGFAPVETKEKHLQKIRSLDKNIKLVAVSSQDTKEIQKQSVDADIIAGSQENIPPIANARELKWIQAFSAGVEKVLTPEVIRSDVLVTNVAGIQDVPIAEHVLGFMLIFTRRFYDTFKKQQQKIWQANQNLTELRSKTVLIVGLGHIGTEVGRLASCIGTHVIAIKQNIKDKPSFVSQIYTTDQLENILPTADFVVLSLPLTPQTKLLFEINKFKLMKKSAVIINIGRGALIKEKDLIKALEQKIIAGAGLDVTEEEPLPKESKLWQMENVVITPHHSGPSEKFMDRAIDLFCVNLKAYLANKPLPNMVDKKRGY